MLWQLMPDVENNDSSAREIYRRELKSNPEWLATWDSGYVSALKAIGVMPGMVGQHHRNLQ